MKFHTNLYIGASIKNPGKVKRQLKRKFGRFDIYIIILAHGDDQLEFFRSIYLKQKSLRQLYLKQGKPLHVVGIAGSHDEACGIVEDITADCLAKTGTADLKQFLLSSE
ncbi:MAG: hypothetical protein LBC96_01845 [Lachnospiraceae bacterium]|nr:hypothetical protein [Lachnospiraceae bacterium]